MDRRQNIIQRPVFNAYEQFKDQNTPSFFLEYGRLNNLTPPQVIDLLQEFKTKVLSTSEGRSTNMASGHVGGREAPNDELLKYEIKLKTFLLNHTNAQTIARVVKILYSVEPSRIPKSALIDTLLASYGGEILRGKRITLLPEGDRRFVPSVPGTESSYSSIPPPKTLWAPVDDLSNKPSPLPMYNSYAFNTPATRREAFGGGAEGPTHPKGGRQQWPPAIVGTVKHKKHKRWAMTATYPSDSRQDAGLFGRGGSSTFDPWVSQVSTQRSPTPPIQGQVPSFPSTRSPTPPIQGQVPSFSSTRSPTPPIQGQVPSFSSTRSPTPPIQGQVPSFSSTRSPTPPIQGQVPSFPSTRSPTPPIQGQVPSFPSTRSPTPLMQWQGPTPEPSTVSPFKRFASRQTGESPIGGVYNPLSFNEEQIIVPSKIQIQTPSPLQQSLIRRKALIGGNTPYKGVVQTSLVEKISSFRLISKDNSIGNITIGPDLASDLIKYNKSKSLPRENIYKMAREMSTSSRSFDFDHDQDLEGESLEGEGLEGEGLEGEGLEGESLEGEGLEGEGLEGEGLEGEGLEGEGLEGGGLEGGGLEGGGLEGEGLEGEGLEGEGLEGEGPPGIPHLIDFSTDETGEFPAQETVTALSPQLTSFEKQPETLPTFLVGIKTYRKHRSRVVYELSLIFNEYGGKIIKGPIIKGDIVTLLCEFDNINDSLDISDKISQIKNVKILYKKNKNPRIVAASRPPSNANRLMVIPPQNQPDIIPQPSYPPPPPESGAAFGGTNMAEGHVGTVMDHRETKPYVPEDVPLTKEEEQQPIITTLDYDALMNMVGDTLPKILSPAETVNELASISRATARTSSQTSVRSDPSAAGAETLWASARSQPSLSPSDGDVFVTPPPLMSQNLNSKTITPREAVEETILFLAPEKKQNESPAQASQYLTVIPSEVEPDDSSESCPPSPMRQCSKPYDVTILSTKITPLTQEVDKTAPPLSLTAQAEDIAEAVNKQINQLHGIVLTYSVDEEPATIPKIEIIARFDKEADANRARDILNIDFKNYTPEIVLTPVQLSDSQAVDMFFTATYNSLDIPILTDVENLVLENGGQFVSGKKIRFSDSRFHRYVYTYNFVNPDVAMHVSNLLMAQPFDNIFLRTRLMGNKMKVFYGFKMVWEDIKPFLSLAVPAMIVNLIKKTGSSLRECEVNTWTMNNIPRNILSATIRTTSLENAELLKNSLESLSTQINILPVQTDKTHSGIKSSSQIPSTIISNHQDFLEEEKASIHRLKEIVKNINVNYRPSLDDNDSLKEKEYLLRTTLENESIFIKGEKITADNLDIYINGSPITKPKRGYTYWQTYGPGKKMFLLAVGVGVVAGSALVANYYGFDFGLTGGIKEYYETTSKGVVKRFYDAAGTVVNVYDTSVEGVKGLYDTTTGAVRGFYDATTGSILGVYDTAVENVKGLYDTTTGAAKGVYDIATGAVLGIYNITTAPFRSFYNATTGLATGVYNITGNVLGMAVDNPLTREVTSLVSAVFGGLSTIYTTLRYYVDPYSSPQPPNVDYMTDNQRYYYEVARYKERIEAEKSIPEYSPFPTDIKINVSALQYLKKTITPWLEGISNTMSSLMARNAIPAEMNDLAVDIISKVEESEYLLSTDPDIVKNSNAYNYQFRGVDYPTTVYKIVVDALASIKANLTPHISKGCDDGPGAKNVLYQLGAYIPSLKMTDDDLITNCPKHNWDPRGGMYTCDVGNSFPNTNIRGIGFAYVHDALAKIFRSYFRVPDDYTKAGCNYD
jgi:hypothetical protein